MDLKNIVKEFFPNENPENVLKSIEGDNEAINQKLAAKTLGKKIISSKQPLPVTEDVFNSIFSLAEFAGNEESLYVSRIFYKNIENPNPIPFLIDYFNELNSEEKKQNEISREFAEKCLVSTSIHYNRLYERYKMKGSPKPEFYISMGEGLFEKLGDYNLSQNFEKWRNFVREVFAN